MKKERYYILIFVVLGLLLAGIVLMFTYGKGEGESWKSPELKVEKKEEVKVESVNLLEEDVDFDADFLETENGEELDSFDESLEFETIQEDDLKL